jgi:hypothetical protein
MVGLPGVVLLLGLLLATQYPHALTLPFVNDDYFLLDRTRVASFVSLWKRQDLIFGWYRPWSRELHYWVLQHVFGTAEVGYHLVSLALWLGVLGLYFAWVRRTAGRATASIATAGLASLALWGAPLLWVAGAQDLWTLLFALGFLYLLALGRSVWAVAALALALLSKESAVVLPCLATAYVVLIERRKPRDAILRTLPFWLLTAGWAASHPMLGARLLGSLRASMETAHRLSPTLTFARTLLAQVNLDTWPHPGAYAAQALAQGAVGAGVLGLLVWLGAAPRGSAESPSGVGRVVLLGLIWAAVGWSILFMPSIGWHPYYGVVGSLGAWLALGALLARHWRTAVGGVAALALLRGADACTPSWDWGSEWYQRRAGNILGAIRRELVRQHPAFPAQARIFFVHIPNNIGLLAGDGPSLRVWYRDTSLRAGYYSDYRPRPDTETQNDFFFRFDSTAGMIEVHRGPEDVERARYLNPAWEGDHDMLAALFLRAGDLRGASEEYAKLASLPSRMDCLFNAGVCQQLMGDSVAAESCYRTLAARMGCPLAAVEDSVRTLIAELSHAPPQ